MWNLEKWYRWYLANGLQGRNRVTDVENKCMDTKGEKRGEVRWKVKVRTMYILCTVAVSALLKHENYRVRERKRGR